MQVFDVDRKRAEIILILVGIGFSVGLAVTLNLNPLMPYKSDLLPRWYATQKLMLEGRSIYDPQNGLELFQTYSPNILSPQDANFFYPAHLLIITIGLALIPYQWAHLLWTFLGQIFYLASLWLGMKMLDFPTSFKSRTLVMLMAVFFIPALQQAIWTQFNTIGLLSLVLSLLALQKGKYALAGVLISGLTFKPQALLLTLVFLLLWSLFDRRRWNFFLGFLGTMLGLLIFTLLVQPGWPSEFIGAIDVYFGLTYFEVESVLDNIWNPSQMLAGANLLSALYLFLRNRKAAIRSPAFAGCIGLSVGVWFLVVPVIGTLHLVALPIAAVFVVWSLRELDHPFYRLAAISLIALYLLGWIGFVSGLLASPGMQVALMELVYKVMAPVVLTLLALPSVLGMQVREPNPVQALPG